MNRAVLRNLLVVLLFVGCAMPPGTSERNDGGFRTLPPDLPSPNWTSTPVSVLKSPVKNEPLVWLGLVKNVYVSEKRGKVEIEWLCEHLVFLEPGPAAISVRPIRARKGQGYFAVSLIADGMPVERAMQFKANHTGLRHYLLVGGKFAGLVDRDGRRVPVLSTLRLDIAANLAVVADQ